MGMYYPSHHFIKGVTKSGNKDIEYGKCINCGSVIFYDNENPYYNMACNSPRSDWGEREKLRKELESK